MGCISPSVAHKTGWHRRILAVAHKTFHTDERGFVGSAHLAQGLVTGNISTAFRAEGNEPGSQRQAYFLRVFITEEERFAFIDTFHNGTALLLPATLRAKDRWVFP